MGIVECKEAPGSRDASFKTAVILLPDTAVFFSDRSNKALHKKGQVKARSLLLENYNIEHQPLIYENVVFLYELSFPPVSFDLSSFHIPYLTAPRSNEKPS